MVFVEEFDVFFKVDVVFFGVVGERYFGVLEVYFFGGWGVWVGVVKVDVVFGVVVNEFVDGFVVDFVE